MRLCLAALLAFALLAAPDATAQEREQPVRTLRTYEVGIGPAGSAQTGRVEVAFDYERGVALRRTYDAAGTLLSERDIEGQPAPSDDEVEEARALVLADAELAGLVAETGATVEGGFIHFGDEAVPACADRARCLQLDLVTPSRMESVRFVVVDLVSRRIVERDLFPEL